LISAIISQAKYIKKNTSLEVREVQQPSITIRSYVWHDEE
jgi:hypothetical protein